MLWRMRWSGLAGQALCGVVVCLALASCGGGGPATSAGGTVQPPGAAGLPAVPSGELDLRYASLVDSDAVDGAAYVDSAHASPDGVTAARLEPGSGPGFQAAWALYPIAKRAGQPSMLTVTGYYFDPDPLAARAGEGFWVGLANYGTLRWDWSGPYASTSQVRIPIAPGMNVASGGGMVYCCVVAAPGNTARVVQVQVGYDTGPGYEDYWLAPPPGETAGRCNDIQLSPAGDVQIAYLRGPGVFGAIHDQAYIIRWTGAQWLPQHVPTPYYISYLRFAIGDSGYRALLVMDAATNDLHLLRDHGTGDFTTDDIIVAGAEPDYLGSVIYINGADNPAGLLDTVLCTYCDAAAPPNINTRFYRQTEGGPLPVVGDIVGAPTRPPGRLTLTRTSNKTALVTVPSAPAWPTWNADVGEFAALTDTWNFALAPAWPALNVTDGGEFQPAATILRLPGGALLGAYINKDKLGVNLALDAAAWADDPLNYIPGAFGDKLDIESFPDGRVGFLGMYGSNSPMLVTGTPGAGSWTRRYISSIPWSGMESSLAITSTGTCVAASMDAARGSLRYYRITDSQITAAEIDKGGGAPGITMGDVALAYAAGQLNAFFVDNSHLRLMRAVNENGVWLNEGVPVTADGYPYVVVDAGYLEQSGLLYAAYLDAVDYSIWIASGLPDGTDWVARRFIAVPNEGFEVADDGQDIGVVGMHMLPGDHAYAFYLGSPREGTPIEEIISPNGDLVDYPQHLAYNAANSRWGLACTAQDGHYAYYFERQAPYLWAGPYIVASELGAGGEIYPAGLSYSASGSARVPVAQKVAGGTVWNINIYAAPDLPVFTLLSNLGAYDTAALDVQIVWSDAQADGEPQVAVIHRLIAATTWDVTVYEPTGPGAWAPDYVWPSQVHDITDSEMGFDILVLPDNRSVLSLVENDAATPQFGQAQLHYPW